MAAGGGEETSSFSLFCCWSFLIYKFPIPILIRVPNLLVEIRWYMKTDFEASEYHSVSFGTHSIFNLLLGCNDFIQCPTNTGLMNGSIDR